MSGLFEARNKVAIVGYAQSPIVKSFGRPVGQVAVEVAREAIVDAGLSVKDIDGFTGSALIPSAGDHSTIDGVTMVTPTWLAGALGVNPRYAVGFQGAGQLPGSVALAVNALAAGAADYVVVHRALHNPGGSYHSSSQIEARGNYQWVMPQGWWGPLPMIGMATNQYLQRYGATREQLGAVAVEARKNGARVPWSVWHDRPIELADYLDSPMVVEPVCRFDCDMPIDGVGCFVLTRADRAKALPNKPVYVSGYANGQPKRNRLAIHWPIEDMREVGSETARRLRELTGFAPESIDLPQIYDGFSLFAWMWLEVLGFCPEGEAARFVADGGIDSDDPNALPALSGGGALGNGRLHGVPQMLECYLQLSGRAGDRQRPNVTTALACHGSPHYGGVVVYSADDA